MSDITESTTTLGSKEKYNNGDKLSRKFYSLLIIIGLPIYWMTNKVALSIISTISISSIYMICNEDTSKLPKYLKLFIRYLWLVFAIIFIFVSYMKI